jgi:undecaprenyl-diphosphatase
MMRRINWSDGRVAIALFVIICVSVIFTLSLSVEAAASETVTGDVAVSQWVQQVSLPGVGYAVGILNWIGRPIPLAALTGIVAIALFARRRYGEAILVLPTTFTHAVNFVLKDIVQSPRPTNDYVRISDQATGFGFPSGHTMAIVVFCGVMTYIAWRLIACPKRRCIVYALVALAVVGIGFSRIYSGAHWPSDVLGAYLWGTFYTVALVLVFHRLRPVSPAGAESAFQPSGFSHA